MKPKDDLGKMCDVCKAYHDVKPKQIDRIRQQIALEIFKDIEQVSCLDKGYLTGGDILLYPEEWDKIKQKYLGDNK